jgi:tetratricopeptide (TPR) repeat protein
VAAGLRLWQGLLLLGLVILAWRITALGVASVQVGHLDSHGEAAARLALDWYPGQSAALYRLGFGAIERDGEAAERLLVEAYRHNQTDPRPLMDLAHLALARNELARADALMGQVDRLRPVDPGVQWRLGQYWSSRGDLGLAFKHWSRSLEADPGSSPAAFQAFRALLKDPAASLALQSLTKDPPGWWQDFFADTAQRATDIATVRQLYQMRSRSAEVPMTPGEHQAYFARLMRDGLFEEAYIAWTDSLNAAQRKQLGLLFNGSFELPLSGLGFDWQVTKINRVEIARARPEGEERQALLLRFRLLRVPFEHLGQPLVLVPGAYEMAGSFRSLDLMTEGGFRWVVRCRAPDQAQLGESGRLFPAEAWTTFRFEFEVPDSCLMQELRLVSADASGAEKNPIDGELWFDELSIRSLGGLTPLGRAKIESRRLEAEGRGKRPGRD